MLLENVRTELTLPLYYHYHLCKMDCHMQNKYIYNNNNNLTTSIIKLICPFTDENSLNLKRLYIQHTQCLDRLAVKQHGNYIFVPTTKQILVCVINTTLKHDLLLSIEKPVYRLDGKHSLHTFPLKWTKNNTITSLTCYGCITLFSISA